MTDAEYLDWFKREFWRMLHGRCVGPHSRIQRDALSMMNFQAELNNGGMHQYLLNSPKMQRIAFTRFPMSFTAPRIAV